MVLPFDSAILCPAAAPSCCCCCSHLERPCHVSKHPIDFTLHGVVKAKPAKVRVNVNGSTTTTPYSYSYSYGSSGDKYLPGTSLIAYLPAAPAYDGYDGGYNGGKGKLLLKYVLNWHNDEVCLPGMDGNTDTITPRTPVEPGSHPKLPLVDPGTFGLFVKHGHYDDEPYGEPHYEDHHEPHGDPHYEPHGEPHYEPHHGGDHYGPGPKGGYHGKPGKHGSKHGNKY